MRYRGNCLHVQEDMLISEVGDIDAKTIYLEDFGWNSGGVR